MRILPRLKDIENGRKKVAKTIREIQASTRDEKTKERLVKRQKERQNELIKRGNQVLRLLSK